KYIAIETGKRAIAHATLAHQAIAADPGIDEGDVGPARTREAPSQRRRPVCPGTEPGSGAIGQRVAEYDNGANASGRRNIKAINKVPRRRLSRIGPSWSAGIVSPRRHVGFPVRLIVHGRRTGRYV